MKAPWFSKSFQRKHSTDPKQGICEVQYVYEHTGQFWTSQFKMQRIEDTTGLKHYVCWHPDKPRKVTLCQVEDESGFSRTEILKDIQDWKSQ